MTKRKDNQNTIELTPTVGIGCFVCLAMGFTALSGIVVGLAMPISDMYHLLDWDERPCEITVSEVVPDESAPEGVTLKIGYTFELGGKTLNGSGYGVADHTLSKSEIQQIVAELPVGTKTICYTDLAGGAILHRGTISDLIPGFLSLGWLIAAFIGFRYFLRKGREAHLAKKAKIGKGSDLKPKRRVVKPPPLEPTISRVDGDPAPLAPPPEEGPLDLDVESGPIKSFILITIFALFWNGITSIFVVSVAQGIWHGSVGSWVMGIFLLPFVVIGLGLIVLVPYQFLKMFNPRTHLRVKRAPFRLGEAVEVEWEFHGNAARIDRLTVRLEGTEEAEYWVGTSRRSDSHDFFDEELFSTEEPAQIAAGRLMVEVPADKVPTFTASNNKVVWSLVVEGSIPRWPDVEDSFQIQVLPPRKGRRR